MLKATDKPHSATAHPAGGVYIQSRLDLRRCIEALLNLPQGIQMVDYTVCATLVRVYLSRPDRQFFMIEFQLQGNRLFSLGAESSDWQTSKAAALAALVRP
jgi:hypothetical protein